MYNEIDLDCYDISLVLKRDHQEVLGSKLGKRSLSSNEHKSK